ncbi:MAG: hypothetical protein U5O39_11330 [Gammaproteobacteria bacterium]|nr:hypothetical protein [Gammaproteobacteria bacterium]
MIDPVTLLAIGMLVVADGLLAAALLFTSIRLQFRHLALAAIALSFELLRQISSLVVAAVESGTWVLGLRLFRTACSIFWSLRC